MPVKTALRQEARRIYDSAVLLEGGFEIIKDETVNAVDSIIGYVEQFEESIKEIWAGLALMTAIIEGLPDDE